MDGDNQLILKNISFAYKKNQPVLKNISMKLSRSKILAILGPNGSGKTTLTKIVIGVLKPYPPNAFIGEKNLFHFTDKERARLIAWVPQETARNIPLTVKDYVLLGRLPHVSSMSTPKQKDQQITIQALKALGIEDLKEKFYMELSGGQRRIVTIARALAQQTDYIVLDEPTAHLDYKNKVTVLKIIRILAENGKGVLFTTHDPNEAIAIAHEIILLSKGEIKANGPPEILLDDTLLSQVYEMPIKVVNCNGEKYIKPVF